MTTFYKNLFIILSLVLLSTTNEARELTHHLSHYGLKPNTSDDSSPIMEKALRSIASQPTDQSDTVRILLPKGRYNFYPSKAAERTYFISNHDQTNPKRVGLPFEGFNNMIFDGQGSELIFHGRMLPISLLRSDNCTLKNFSIDFKIPQITQIKILNNDSIKGITFEVSPETNYEIRDGVLVIKGLDWENTPRIGIAFEKKTRRIVYRTSDLKVKNSNMKALKPTIIQAPDWKDKRLSAETRVALRTWERPAPGIFLSHCANTTINNIQVHYAEGMGLLAQLCENISLDGFSVCLRGKNDPRYFTTQADATHFSACKGLIKSINGLYEGMMDDAINIHGCYLKINKQVDTQTIEASYQHHQAYGFDWGFKGDTIQFINAQTMEIVGQPNNIASIQAIDRPDSHGAKQFRITFEKPINLAINPNEIIGMENLTWTPEVYFANNIIRNNRARGALFSSPRKTVIENNLFDHTSGSAILLCGDCNGWFESGACHDITIRKNRFINSLTNLFQFTNGIISIYPEIPNLQKQQTFFHRNMTIEENEFDTFDAPILFAQSVDGLRFHNNIIKTNRDYPPFHWNQFRFLFKRVKNFDIRNNQFEGGFDPRKEISNEK